MSHGPNGRIASLAALSGHYDNLLCDVWGVLHNGVRVYAQAAEALIAFRKSGGRVVMITNSPRPSEGVIAQFADLGVPDGVFDAVVTSGDATRNLIKTTPGPFHHLGPDRDAPLFDGLDIELAGPNECTTIVCTGLLNDEVENPEDYADRLKPLAARGVPMICANPDLVVERGERMIFCAGSLAQLYEQLGGKTLVAGKPHKPIYDLAMETLKNVIDGAPDKARTIAVGDGLPTDVRGAINNGFDLLYISAGIHSGEYGAADAPDEGLLNAFLTRNNAHTTVWMPRLVWAKD